MAYIHVYNGSPTVGGTDGVQVSEVLPFTASTTSTSVTIGNISVNTNTLTTGQAITGAGIPASTTISTIVDSATITISNAATATANNIIMVQGNLISSGYLNATSNQVSSPIKLAVRCDSGYNSTGSTTITPVAAIPFTGNTTINVAQITSISVNTNEIGIGQVIIGTNIPADTKVTSIVNSSTVNISNVATGTATGVSLTQGDPSKWNLAPDNSGTPGTFVGYGGTLTIASAITTTNTIFWAEAKATSDETPINDLTIAMQTSAQIVAI
jgi:hypothetical protein